MSDGTVRMTWLTGHASVEVTYSWSVLNEIQPVTGWRGWLRRILRRPAYTVATYDVMTCDQTGLQAFFDRGC